MKPLKKRLNAEVLRKLLARPKILTEENPERKNPPRYDFKIIFYYSKQWAKKFLIFMCKK